MSHTYNNRTIVPDAEDFAEIDLLDSNLTPEERYLHAQNLKFHRLACEKLSLPAGADLPGEFESPN